MARKVEVRGPARLAPQTRRSVSAAFVAFGSFGYGRKMNLKGGPHAAGTARGDLEHDGSLKPPPVGKVRPQ